MEKTLTPGSLALAKVTSTKPYGVFVSFQNGEKGLIHISELSDKFVSDIDDYLHPDDIALVYIVSIDDDGFIRASYKKVPKDKFFSTHTDKKFVPMVTEKDFKKIKDNIPKWIELALKEMKENQ